MGFFDGMGGALFSGGMGLIGGIIQNASNEKIAEENREFAERMYKHRYTWAMRDLEYAGLNPILAGIAGQSSASAPSAPAAVDAIGQGVSAFNQTMNTISNMKLNSANEAKATADAAVATQDAAAKAQTNEALPEKIKYELSHQALQNSVLAGQQAVQSATFQKMMNEVTMSQMSIDSSLPPELQQKMKLYKEMFPMLPSRVAGIVSGLLRSGAVGGSALEQGNLRKGLNDYLSGQRESGYWKLYSKTPGFRPNRDGSININLNRHSRNWLDYVDAQYY